MEKVYTKSAPEPVGPYSQAIKKNGFLFCSGQIAINPENNVFIDGTIQEQTEQVMKNISAVLNEAGYDFNDVCVVDHVCRRVRRDILCVVVDEAFFAKTSASFLFDASCFKSRKIFVEGINCDSRFLGNNDNRIAGHFGNLLFACGSVRI